MPRTDPFPALAAHDHALRARLQADALSLVLGGVDEAGRGALAGPVVAGAVVLPADARLPGLDDSKRLTARQRERLAVEIRRQALAWGTGAASAAEIDTLGILRATFLAMARAVDRLEPAPGFLLVDGRDYPFGGRPGRALVRGDGLSAVVAAAGILAKVERDRLLDELEPAHPGWDFGSHKGYGTAAHLEHLRRHGRLGVHRRSFRLPWENDQESLPLA